MQFYSVKRAVGTLVVAMAAVCAFSSEGSLTIMPAIGVGPQGIWNAFISGDGQTMTAHLGGLGINPGNGSTGAFRWTPGSAPQMLPGLGAGIASTTGISYNGAQIAGFSLTNTVQAVRWNGAVPSVFSLPFPDTTFDILGMSSSGNVLVGIDSGGSFVWNNGTLSHPSVGGWTALSASGRYALTGSHQVYDVTASSTSPVTAPNGSTLVAVANDGTVLGYAPSGVFLSKSGTVTNLPGLAGMSLTPTSISPDGSVVVGLTSFNNLSLANGFIWTAQDGTRSFGYALGEQVPGNIPLATALNYSYFPESVTVVDGVAYVAGMVEESSDLRGFIASLRVSQPGLPIDLNGSYAAVKNSLVACTTDPQGIVGEATPGNRVIEPAPLYHSAPFENVTRPPASMSGLNLSGHRYWFDVNLGNPANWPNPSSTQNYTAGQAALGQVGTELQIRASASTTHGIDVTSNNGLLIDFYRKDGRFWAHVTNLWYDQDVNIPYAADATKYHVNVALAANGVVTITFTQMNGVATENGTNPQVVFTMSGGSTSGPSGAPGSIGLDHASFMTSLYNVTPATSAAACPTVVYVGGFATDSVANALYTFVDQPYLATIYPTTLMYAGRLNVANLTRPITGYQASLEQVFQTFVIPLNQPTPGQYENTTLFNAAGAPAFAPADAAGHYDHAQSMTSAATATSADLRLESYLGNFPGASPTYLELLSLYSGGPALTSLLDQNFHTFTPNLVFSNGIMIDTSPPTFANLALASGGTAVTPSRLLLAGQTVTVSVTASDIGSGLACAPVLGISAVDVNGNPVTVSTPTVPLGVSSPSTATFQGSFVFPAGAQTVTLTLSATDRAGNVAAPVTINLHAGLTTTVRLSNTNIAPGTSIQRVLRVVFGGVNGFTPHAVNKVVSFDSTGAGTLGLTDADGLPSPLNPNMTILYVKDPYHTLGKQTPVSVVNGAYSLGAATSITLIGGDANDDNVIDIADLALYATILSDYGTVTASTTNIVNFGVTLPLASVNPDFNGDGVLDDSSSIVSGFGLVGDPDPSLPSPPTPKATLTFAQATALGMPAWVEQSADANANHILTESEILTFIHWIGT